MLNRLFDNYSDLKPNEYNYNDYGAYFDHSCKCCVTLYNVRGYPQCCCHWHRFVCLGSKCDSYKPIIVKPKVIQLSLFD